MTPMSAIRLHTCVPVLLAAGILVDQAWAANYTVTGTIKTSSGTNAGCNQIVKRVKVDIYDDDLGPDDYCGTDWANAVTGQFSVSFSMTLENPDVYAWVVHQYQAPSGKYVYVRNSGSDDTLEEQAGDMVANIPPGTTALGDRHLPSNKANVGTHAGDCLNWVLGHSTGWAMPNDLIGYAMSSGTVSTCSGDAINIVPEDYDTPGATGSAAFSDIHHETGHFLQYNAYGDDWIPHGTFSSHWMNTQTDEGFAVSEGWAEYVAFCTAPPDRKNQLHPSLMPQFWWRGDDGPTGTNNAGDIVEGALWRTWVMIGDFSGTFKVLCDDNPKHIKEWLAGYGADHGWSFNSAFEACQANGIVYTRGKITGFPEGVPSNDAPQSTGNVKNIGGITYLRGIVKPTVEDCTKAELHLGTQSEIIGGSRKRLGYKNAVAGLAQSSTPANWTMLADVEWTADITFDTTTVADDDYDLSVQSENGHGWWDNHDPDFAGDSVANRDSDEKWLKHLRMWYNQDTDPSSDDEGMVIIENTPPVISNRKPQ